MTILVAKTKLNSLITVRETGVSWDYGGPIYDIPETSCTSEHYRIEGFNDGP